MKSKTKKKWSKPRFDTIMINKSERSMALLACYKTSSCPRPTPAPGGPDGTKS